VHFLGYMCERRCTTKLTLLLCLSLTTHGSMVASAVRQAGRRMLLQASLTPCRSTTSLLFSSTWHPNLRGLTTPPATLERWARPQCSRPRLTFVAFSDKEICVWCSLLAFPSMCGIHYQFQDGIDWIGGWRLGRSAIGGQQQRD
jgi:hypothetical protein